MEQSNSVRSNHSSEQPQHIDSTLPQGKSVNNSGSTKTPFWKSDTFFVITIFLFGPLSFLWAPKEIFESQVTITRPSPLKLLMAVFLSFVIPSLFTYMAYSNIDIWKTKPDVAILFMIWIFIFLVVSFISCFTLFPGLGNIVRRNRIIFVISFAIILTIVSTSLDFIVVILGAYEGALPSVIQDNLAIIVLTAVSIGSAITYFKTRSPIHKKMVGTLTVIVIVLTIAILPLFLTWGSEITKMYGNYLKKQGDLVPVVETRMGYTINLYPADGYWQSRELGEYSRVTSKNGYQLTIEKAQTNETTLEGFVEERIQQIKQRAEERALKQGVSCYQPEFQETVSDDNWQGVRVTLSDCFDVGDMKVYLKHNKNFYVISLNYPLSYANYVNKDANRQRALNNFNLMLASLQFQ
ncbi:hypothetical protein HYU92_05390 [Candidatus Curtissbacteria bacterium]|nr:hypothetical protein [Candidatus Curtissbacteria bacterium]